MVKVKYELHSEQASVLAIDAIRRGIPKEYVERVLEISNKAYFLGRADHTIKRGENQGEYELPLDRLEQMALLKPRDDDTDIMH